jgi:hypothetical protein
LLLFSPSLLLSFSPSLLLSFSYSIFPLILHFPFTREIVDLLDLPCVSPFVWWTCLHQIRVNLLNSWFQYILILFIVLVNLEELRQLRTKQT